MERMIKILCCCVFVGSLGDFFLSTNNLNMKRDSQNSGQFDNTVFIGSLHMQGLLADQELECASFYMIKGITLQTILTKNVLFKIINRSQF